VKTALIAAARIGDTSFRESDLELFQIFCRQASVAMENAELYEEQRENLRKVKESQQALVQAEKIATAGRLTASIAHEVNNPLQAMQNCLHLAGRTDLPEDKQKEYLGMASTELERLMLTVQRMLDFYRPSGASFEKVNVGEALQYVLDLMAKQMSDSGITSTINLPADLPKVLAIQNQIQQVFINIILNASDAMVHGGRLSITGKAIENGVEILFKDTGPGVPTGSEINIFDPFFSTKDGGSGLGLTVSSNIITAHGGTLELIPSQETGACFRLFLPSGGKK
jgi:two-component system NtrC family sensor kinase